MPASGAQKLKMAQNCVSDDFKASLNALMLYFRKSKKRSSETFLGNRYLSGQKRRCCESLAVSEDQGLWGCESSAAARLRLFNSAALWSSLIMKGPSALGLASLLMVLIRSVPSRKWVEVFSIRHVCRNDRRLSDFIPLFLHRSLHLSRPARMCGFCSLTFSPSSHSSSLSQCLSLWIHPMIKGEVYILFLIRNI